MIIIWALFGLVAIARAKHPAPFRTRSLSAEALMVLRLKTWESKSPPNLIKPKYKKYLSTILPVQKLDIMSANWW